MIHEIELDIKKYCKITSLWDAAIKILKMIDKDLEMVIQDNQYFIIRNRTTKEVHIKHDWNEKFSNKETKEEMIELLRKVEL